jgi:energy-coupling factor transporter transmembrane protein EcfT
LAQRLHAVALSVLCAALLALALWLSSGQLLSLLRRTRWIMFSLLLIYAYTTPGTALWEILGVVSPTREGALDGLLQLGRLLSVLSALAILLALLSQTQLISGLYALAYPLQWFGLSRERIAVRLALTLEYAESAMRDTASDWKSTIRDALRPATAGASHIELGVESIGLVDLLVLLAGIATLIGVWR